MNILYVRESFQSDEPTGGGAVAWRLCNGLAGRGHRLFVIAGRSQNAARHEVLNGIQIYRPFAAGGSVMRRAWFAVRLYPYLHAFLKQNSIDVVCNHAYAVTVATTLAASKHHIPVITSVRLLCGKTWFRLTNPFVATLNCLMEVLVLRCGRHTVIHSPSQAVAEQVQRYSTRKTVAIPNPLDLDEIEQVRTSNDAELIRQNLGIKQHEQFLLFVGSLLKVKNVDGLVRAFSNSKPHFKLVIIGEGPERPKIEKLVKRLGFEDRVILLGQKPHRETLSIMKSCDVLVLPSKSEVFPNTVIEALALRKPVIATRVGGIPEIESENLYLISSLEEINWLLEEGIQPREDDRLLQDYSLDDIIVAFESLFRSQIKSYGES